MAGGVRGVTALQDELTKAKEGLKDVDENIKKLIGRTPGESRPGQRRQSAEGGRGGGATGGRDRLFNIARRGIMDSAGGPPPAKRRNVGGAFSRLGPRVGGGGRPFRQEMDRDSGDEADQSHKPAVSSSVVAASADNRSKRDVIDEQNKDTRGKQRNKRMFGLLLGTLQRFQHDAKVKSDKDKQRREIEQKLEEKAEEEKDELKKERQSLFNERRQKQAQLKRLEAKMELVKSFEEYEDYTKDLKHFIRTKAKPHIFYLPKSHSSATKEKLKTSVQVVEDMIAERRKNLEEEVAEITKRDEKEKEQQKQAERLKQQEEEDEEDDEEDSDSEEDVEEQRESKGHDKENRSRDGGIKEKREEYSDNEEGEEGSDKGEWGEEADREASNKEKNREERSESKRRHSRTDSPRSDSEKTKEGQKEEPMDEAEGREDQGNSEGKDDNDEEKGGKDADSMED